MSIFCMEANDAFCFRGNNINLNRRHGTIKALIPMGRLGLPEEIASIVDMLVDNGYMTNKVSMHMHYG
jgi:NAD(P)-dependent dehydrogenase (short-subunit alcohol dehydrogenase family)